MKFLSSNAYSTDNQIADVLSYLSNEDEYKAVMDKFVEEFPEYNSLTWLGAWVDTEVSGVDSEYMNWVADWIEANTDVTWHEGEPVIFESADEYDSAEIDYAEVDKKLIETLWN